MTALVVAETAVLLLLGLLVAGLLRSHAEILRALHELRGVPLGVPSPRTGGANVVSELEFPGVRPGVAPPRATGAAGEARGFDIAGMTPVGETAIVGVTDVSGTTLIAFLTSGCSTCASFWREFQNPDRLGLPLGMRLVIVTKGEGDESPSAVAELAPGWATTVMSSQAWLDHEVPVSPYFLLVDGPTGRVIGEGAATSWRQVRDLMTQALDDMTFSAGSAVTQVDDELTRDDGAARADRELMAAGIYPGDPSLYPAAGEIPERP
jgi:hypothetical protein